MWKMRSVTMIICWLYILNISHKSKGYRLKLSVRNYLNNLFKQIVEIVILAWDKVSDIFGNSEKKYENFVHNLKIANKCEK